MAQSLPSTIVPTLLVLSILNGSSVNNKNGVEYFSRRERISKRRRTGRKKNLIPEERQLALSVTKGIKIKVDKYLIEDPRFSHSSVGAKAINDGREKSSVGVVEPRKKPHGNSLYFAGLGLGNCSA